jgi:hypothetical protein
MTRKRSRRDQATVNRRARLQSPPPGRAAEARAAGQRHDKPSGSTTDRGSVTCGWCGAVVTFAARGRVPKWCSATCRHRAWEQRRAAASGLVAVEVVDRPVEVVRTVTKVKRVLVEVPRPATVGTNRDWAQQLANLADDLDRGRIYDREVESLMPAMTALVAAFNRRYR